MKTLILAIIFSVFAFSALAQLISIETAPSRPVVNQTFKLIFKYSTASDTDPFISFNPGVLQVDKKYFEGVSTSTKFINGKIVTTKTASYVYELTPESAGPAYIRNINVEIDGKSYKSKDLMVNVLYQAPKPETVFLLAIPSKTNVFVGEGLDVNFYLYLKAPLINLELLEHPKFNRFLKRFHFNPNTALEAVQYEGEIYQRSLQYSVRLYAEKPGTYFVDSLRLKVTTQNTMSNSYGSSYGNRNDVKTIANRPIEISVQALPTENLPTDFTGLVGDHTFKIIKKRSVYAVNDPVEIKLEVAGPGALEIFEAPTLYKDPALEEFDTKGELEEVGNTSGKKTFDYTYLARATLDIPAKNITFSTFDPESFSYKQTTIELPRLFVSGATPVKTPSTTDDKPKDDTKNIAKPQALKEKISPLIFDNIIPWSMLAESIFIIILAIATLYFALMIIKKIQGQSLPKEIHQICRELKKNGPSYPPVFKLISHLKPNLNSDDSYSIREILQESQMSNNAKEYFQQLILQSEKKTYNNETNPNFKYNKIYFKELLKQIKKAAAQSKHAKH